MFIKKTFLISVMLLSSSYYSASYTMEQEENESSKKSRMESIKESLKKLIGGREKRPLLQKSTSFDEMLLPKQFGPLLTPGERKSLEKSKSDPVRSFAKEKTEFESLLLSPTKPSRRHTDNTPTKFRQLQRKGSALLLRKKSKEYSETTKEFLKELLEKEIDLTKVTSLLEKTNITEEDENGNTVLMHLIQEIANIGTKERQYVNEERIEKKVGALRLILKTKQNSIVWDHKNKKGETLLSFAEQKAKKNKRFEGIVILLQQSKPSPETLARRQSPIIDIPIPDMTDPETKQE